MAMPVANVLTNLGARVDGAKDKIIEARDRVTGVASDIRDRARKFLRGGGRGAVTVHYNARGPVLA